MADTGQQSAPQSTPQTSRAAEPQKSETETRYPREVLIAESNPRLGASRAEVAGALSSESTKTFTVTDAKRLVKEFRERSEESDER